MRINQVPCMSRLSWGNLSANELKYRMQYVLLSSKCGWYVGYTDWHKFGFDIDYTFMIYGFWATEQEQPKTFRADRGVGKCTGSMHPGGQHSLIGHFRGITQTNTFMQINSQGGSLWILKAVIDEAIVAVYRRPGEHRRLFHLSPRQICSLRKPLESPGCLFLVLMLPPPSEQFRRHSVFGLFVRASVVIMYMLT